MLSLGTLIASTLVDPGTDFRNTIVSFRISAPDETSGFVGDRKFKINLFLSLLSTRWTSRTVPPVVAATHPQEWTGDPVFFVPFVH